MRNSAKLALEVRFQIAGLLLWGLLAPSCCPLRTPASERSASLPLKAPLPGSGPAVTLGSATSALWAGGGVG